jgi:hypothetical protein
MSEQANQGHPDGDNEAGRSGATSQEYGNLSVEDDADGTVDPAQLAGTGGPEDDAVDR